LDSECIVCRMRQVLDMCKFVDADEAQRQEVLDRVMDILVHRDIYEPSGEIGFMIHNEVKRILDLDDPYQSVKEVSIRKALAIYPRLKKLVRTADNPLKRAVEICIAGNVIDFAPSNSHDIEAAVEEVIASEKNHFDWEPFTEVLDQTDSILMLADNAGETVFDRIFIEELDKPIKYAVKSEPVSNDAVVEDAVASGLEPLVEIIENGSPMAGTVLQKCSREFLDLYQNAEMIISKGQANFETLVHEKRRIFFLFKVKCDLLSRKHDIPMNEYVLLDNHKLHPEI